MTESSILDSVLAEPSGLGKVEVSYRAEERMPSALGAKGKAAVRSDSHDGKSSTYAGLDWIAQRPQRQWDRPKSDIF